MEKLDDLVSEIKDLELHEIFTATEKICKIEELKKEEPKKIKLKVSDFVKSKQW